MKAKIALVIALLGWTMPASAQAVKMEFRGGRVSLSAQNASLRAILAEWTRLGGTRIVNGERVTGPAVTLELTGVTERQAIDVLLRNAAGYIVGPRETGSSAASSFASIVILPTSVAPRQTVSSAAPARVVRPPIRSVEPEPELDPEEELFSDVPDDDRLDIVRQAAEEAARRRIADRRAQFLVGDQVVEQSDDDDAPTAAPTTGSNPFGILPGAVRPGVITAPPPQAPNGRARQPDPEP
jgi:hypothetical protein